ncbi:Uncharacterized conserved protein YcfJ, contains glycine zipper 2TM domain [Pseudoxanthomonas sp. CF385]|uniref:hypothetical protein n=1 Tax=Pseudoxanthomonas sp. CF385 TaxID=1881042 RepID=UPI000887EC0D|nr:hypothetical protein [Pseudoxanthomonas sp. CF385]SDQ58722.1 Uncharacterized conserved protein YcfJ, contains glycine zipper 2TM domain [Pseudoxanthomonas sp. CF385]
MHRFRAALFLSCLLACAPLLAQERVIPTENVRLDYAQVLSVEPVYQTLRATRTEQRCDEVPAVKPEPATREEESRWSKMVSSVKGWFGSDEASAPPVAPPASTVRTNCRAVPVEREFQRPIAYDVDYIYKGVKYRSRLAEDPGNRLRIRVSVVPYVTPMQPAASTP